MKGLDISSLKPLNLRPPQPQSTATSSSTATHRPTMPERRASTWSLETRKRTADSAPLPARKRSKVPSLFNRVHTRIITARGRPLHTFTSNLELLLALHAAITGHRALLHHGILHRDISISNILLTAPPQHGLLIDLDLALPVDSVADSTTHHRTGTMEFMAIGALCGEAHTYRHDLESFFYVLLWVCTHFSPGVAVVHAPRVLDAWGKLSYSEAASAKRGDMDPGGFEIIVAQFVQSAVGMKPLVWRLRDVLFPVRSRLFTGTERDAGPVYEAVLQAFADAIRVLRVEA